MQEDGKLSIATASSSSSQVTNAEVVSSVPHTPVKEAHGDDDKAEEDNDVIRGSRIGRTRPRPTLGKKRSRGGGGDGDAMHGDGHDDDDDDDDVYDNDDDDDEDEDDSASGSACKRGRRSSGGPIAVSLGRSICDPVHGFVELPKWAWDIIDTPQFQRLRGLRQLGVTHFVFPGATHTRFEHSIGVCHLARQTMLRFQQRQPDLRITDAEVRMVATAGLCHDLGHGPFSHAFEGWVRRTPGREAWCHEDMSLSMLDFIVEDNGLAISDATLAGVKSLIKGKKPKGCRRGFLYEVVANYRNSIDVDKFDYLSRDRYNIGYPKWDCQRLMQHSRVIDDEICYASKVASQVYQLFRTRYEMFSEVYCHKKGIAIELLVSDALAAADHVLHISDAVDDAAKYQYLNDSILTTIESSDLPGLEEAKRLVLRLRKRDHYKFCDELLVPASEWKHSQALLGITASDVAKSSSVDRAVSEDIVRVHVQTMNYAMKSDNPVDAVHFFNPKYNLNEKFGIRQGEVSALLPAEYAEKIITVFTTDRSRHSDVQAAFRTCLRRRGFVKTPNRHLLHPLNSPKRKPTSPYSSSQ